MKVTENTPHQEPWPEAPPGLAHTGQVGHCRGGRLQMLLVLGDKGTVVESVCERTRTRLSRRSR